MRRRHGCLPPDGAGCVQPLRQNDVVLVQGSAGLPQRLHRQSLTGLDLMGIDRISHQFDLTAEHSRGAINCAPTVFGHRSLWFDHRDLPQRKRTVLSRRSQLLSCLRMVDHQLNIISSGKRTGGNRHIVHAQDESPLRYSLLRIPGAHEAIFYEGYSLTGSRDQAQGDQIIGG